MANRREANKSFQKTKRRKLNIVKIVGALLIVTFIVSASINITNKLVKNSTNTFVVRTGNVSKDETVISYIVRKETIIPNEDNNNGMEKIITEGEKVAKGESVYRYYSKSEDENNAKIADLDKQIDEAIKNSTEGLLPSDVRLLNEQIETEVAKINKINSEQNLQESKKRINEYLQKKAKITGDASPSGSHLRELINERKKYQDELVSNSKYITAPESGLLSYRIDGYEEKLNTNDFSVYTKDFLNSLDLKTGQIVPSSDNTGKIVNNFECYLICIINSEEAKNAKLGDEVKIALPSGDEVEADVHYITDEKSDRVITFKIKNGIDELLSYRKLNLDVIWWSAKGYKIPNSAIIQQNNLNYVIRSRNGYLTKVLVKIKKQTDDYSIVTNYSSSEIEELNVDTNAKTSILLYDNILQRPTQQDIDSTK